MLGEGNQTLLQFYPSKEDSEIIVRGYKKRYNINKQEVTMSKYLSIKIRKQPAIIINRIAFRDNKLVYIARANKKLRYPWGKSRIAYIGTTKRGARRIASSAAWKGEDLLFGYGVKHLEFNFVTCRRVPGLESWKKLERALLIRFREKYGAVPRGNNIGKKMHWKVEEQYFSTKTLDKIIETLG